MPLGTGILGQHRAGKGSALPAPPAHHRVAKPACPDGNGQRGRREVKLGRCQGRFYFQRWLSCHCMYQTVKALCIRVGLSVLLLLSKVDLSCHWRNNLDQTGKSMAVVGTEPKSQAMNSTVRSAQRSEDEIWKCLIFLLLTSPSLKRQEQTASILLGAL